MSFLSPWFLLGALTIAGPILFHLIRRVARERVRFSSILFLRPTPPRATRRRRLEDLWLLLLRCLCLLLLTTAFARPFFLNHAALPLAKEDGRQLLILVDTSASMRREGVWEKARAAVERLLNEASPADQLAVLTFDRQTHALISFGDWNSWPLDQRAGMARQRLAAVAPSWMGTQLGLALTTAAEQFQNDSLKDTVPARRELALITDLQDGAKLDGLQGYEWPMGVKVRVEPVSAKRRNNAGIGLANDVRKNAEDSGIAVRLLNTRESEREKFQVRWKTDAGFAGGPIDAYVSGGQARTLTIPGLPVGTKTVQFQLSGDDEAFDNSASFVVPQTEQLKICWLGDDASNDPARLRFYLERVFSDTPRRKVAVVSSGLGNAGLAELLKSSALAVVAKTLDASESQTLREWLGAGKTALLVLTNARMAPTLAALAGLPEARLTEAAGNYALLAQIDFTHPIFAPFADPRFSDFAGIHFWKHRRWEIPGAAPAHVLASFDDGSPALAQLSVGKGNLLILAAGWNPADSQFAVSSKFPPLVQTILDWARAEMPTRFQFQTGDSIPAPAASGTAIQWRKPDGSRQSLPAGTAFDGTEAPGIYTATFDGQERKFAVNLPLEESRTTPMSIDELSRLGVPLQTGAEPSVARVRESARHLQRAELEHQQKLWRWLIVAALVVTFGEILLSGWLARRATKMESGKTNSGKPVLQEDVA